MLMRPSHPVAAAFEQRAARAAALAATSPSAEAALGFAAGLYRAQAELAATIATLHQQQPLVGELEHDADGFFEPARALFRFAAEAGPRPLSDEALARAREEAALGRSRLLVFWAGDRSSREDYLSRAVLRPYAEVLARVGVEPRRPRREGWCPFCGGPPWIAARRAASQGDGAQRMLGCALCGDEWSGGRSRCPACGEEDPSKLPIFRSEAHPAVRVEACDTCHSYVKSIDLTLDARPIPEVDDLLSLAMDLWASEEGLTRIEPGLSGV